MMTLAVYLAALGDAAAGALIAGVFSVLNIVLTAVALRWLNQGNRKLESNSRVTADAARAAAEASESAANAAIAAGEACRVAKSIGAQLRHEDHLAVVKRDQLEGGPP
jgi:hypothetical protein